MPLLMNYCSFTIVDYRRFDNRLIILVVRWRGAGAVALKTDIGKCLKIPE